jgi:hypothetical protein
MHNRHELSSNSGGNSQATGLSSTRAALSMGALCLMVAALFVFRPQGHLGSSTSVQNTQSCLANLSRIAQAFVHMLKITTANFPRGVTGDRNDPRGWAFQGLSCQWKRLASGRLLERRAHRADADTSCYRPTRATHVWRCPADTGWSTRTRDEEARAVCGAACATCDRLLMRGSAPVITTTRSAVLRLAPEDLLEPSLSISLFDGDAWHITMTADN